MINSRCSGEGIVNRCVMLKLSGDRFNEPLESMTPQRLTCLWRKWQVVFWTETNELRGFQTLRNESREVREVRGGTNAALSKRADNSRCFQIDVSFFFILKIVS